MTLEGKWREEFDEFEKQNKILTRFDAYLSACRKRQEEIDALNLRMRDLECLLCISHDYLLSHWDMEAEPLRKIDKAVKEILREDK